MTTKNGHHRKHDIRICPDNLDCKMVKVSVEDEEFDS